MTTRLALVGLCVSVVLSACSEVAEPDAAVVPTVSTDSSTPAVVGGSQTEETRTSTNVTGLVVPEDREALAREYGLYAPTGEYVGPVDVDGRPMVFEPITGFGDFSAVPRFELDWQHVNASVVDCMQAHGFDLELHADGLGANWSRVPAEQNMLAQAVSWACRAGLRLPAREPRAEEQWAEVLAYQMALRECVASFGYDVPEPPSLDEFIDSEGNWTAYDLVPELFGAAWDELARTCPQGPVGGFGAWDPGDPVQPFQP